uniref:mRNA-capping enzyme subunit beta n=1 Tax=Mycena chlorophos TaxID=658473 RepID=A0ABQ0LHK0_MYCCL|nr:predicted protein [Mycena chlorophos]
MDEFIKEIADWVHFQIMNAPPDLLQGKGGKIEVEAKVGLLRDTRTSQRLMLPVLVESIIAPEYAKGDVRFESNMSMQQHKHFNLRLNDLKLSSSQPGFPASPLGYMHLRLTDSFYPSEDKEKIRVTKDTNTQEVVECLRKIRLGDLNIYSPKRAVDWRVSVNIEVPVSHPIGSPTHSRKKDRLSYTHEEFSIDLTQVTSQTQSGAPELLHELELEFARPDMLVAAAARRGDLSLPELERSVFDELIRAFVNNARILVRNAD